MEAAFKKADSNHELFGSFSQVQKRKGLANRKAFFDHPATQTHITFGSLNASISPLNASIGTQLQNTFLSP